MQLLAATVSALLISVSQPALAQEHHGGLPQDAWQQGEQQLGEPQPQMQPPEMTQPQTEQAETQLPAMPEPRTEQAETQPPAMPQPQTEQAEVPPPAMPEPQTQQAETPPPAMPEPQTQQAEMPQPAMTEPQAQQAEMPPLAVPQPQTEQAEVQPPAMPEPQTAQAEVQQPAMPEPVTQQAEVQQPPMPQPQMQAGNQDVELPRDAQWTVFFEPSLGTRIDLPSAVLSMPDGPAYRGVGRQFKSADGRAAVAIYSQRNNQGDTPARYLRRNFLFPRAAVTYERVTRDFFAVSGVREEKIFYSRCNVSPTGGTLHCFDLQFPARERAAWDAIVTRMSRSLRPLNRS